ncbi:MAG: YdeI/OmpD-associated family protein [Sphingomicrobium sp.]|nr:YdeI/OmpD-associated family protein [Sphingomonadales bacterium]
MTRDPRIDTYIESAAPFARPILEHVRERVHAVVPEVEEDIKWRMPAYLKGGSILIITAAFKGHAALNFWRGQQLASAHDTVDAMGQFGKLKSLDDLPMQADLDRLIREAAERAGTSPTLRKPKHGPKPAPELHPEFAAALAANPTASATLEGFSPSARRDYVEWIAEAKQDSTRAKRIATSVEWLAEGKKRNWKYERC